MRLRKPPHGFGLVVRQPIRWPLLKPRHHPTRKRTALDQPCTFAPVEHAAAVREDVPHRTGAQPSGAFEPEPIGPHILAAHSLDQHGSHERHQVIAQPLRCCRLALRRSLGLDVRLQPPLARCAHRQPSTPSRSRLALSLAGFLDCLFEVGPECDATLATIRVESQVPAGSACSSVHSHRQLRHFSPLSVWTEACWRREGRT